MPRRLVAGEWRPAARDGPPAVGRRRLERSAHRSAPPRLRGKTRFATSFALATRSFCDSQAPSCKRYLSITLPTLTQQREALIPSATPATAAPLDATAAAMGLLSPAEGINYNFILGMYSFFLALGALFAGLEFVLNVEAVKGLSLIHI